MQNMSLKDSLSEILKDPTNVIVSKNEISGNAIDIKYLKENSYETFCYYNKLDDRDADLVELVALLTEKIEKK